MKEVPYWLRNEEQELIELLQQGKSVEEIASSLGRSVEAIRLKTKRMGLAVPNSQKEVNTTTTLEPIKPAENLISVEGAVKLALGAVQRLSEGNLTPIRLKQIRLILSGLKTYVLLHSQYVEPATKIEQRIKELFATVIALMESRFRSSSDENERQYWRKEIDSFKQKIQTEDEKL